MWENAESKRLYQSGWNDGYSSALSNAKDVSNLTDDQIIDLLDELVDLDPVAITKPYQVTYSATYWVRASNEEEAIEAAIESHNDLPNGDWEAELERYPPEGEE